MSDTWQAKILAGIAGHFGPPRTPGFQPLPASAYVTPPRDWIDELVNEQLSKGEGW